MPLSFTNQSLIDAFDSIVFIIFGIAYFSYKPIIPIPPRKILSLVAQVGILLLAGANIGVGIIVWQTFVISNIPVGSIIVIITGIAEILLEFKFRRTSREVRRDGEGALEVAEI